MDTATDQHCLSYVSGRRPAAAAMDCRPVVYLDQGHVSQMVKDLARGVTSPATDLLQQLRELVGRRLIVCPYSLMHVLETAAWGHDEHRRLAGVVMGGLSQGSCFRSPIEIVFDEVDRVLDRILIGSPRQAAIDPLGTGADVYRRERINAAAAASLRLVPDEKKFSFVVEQSREEGSPGFTQIFKSATFAYLRRMADLRRRMPFSQVRKLIRAGYQDTGGGLRRLAIESAQRFALPAEAVIELLARADLDALPTLSMIAEIEARRYVSYGMNPLDSDGTDDAHLHYLPYVSWMLTDARAAALARHAGRSVGCIVLAKAPELAADLQRVFPLS